MGTATQPREFGSVTSRAEAAACCWRLRVTWLGGRPWLTAPRVWWGSRSHEPEPRVRRGRDETLARRSRGTGHGAELAGPGSGQVDLRARTATPTEVQCRPRGVPRSAYLTPDHLGIELDPPRCVCGRGSLRQTI
jgi:hypothetical protein